MPWKSLFKGLDSRPGTPKIGSVPLPSFSPDLADAHCGGGAPACASPPPHKRHRPWTPAQDSCDRICDDRDREVRRPPSRAAAATPAPLKPVPRRAWSPLVPASDDARPLKRSATPAAPRPKVVDSPAPRRAATPAPMRTYEREEHDLGRFRVDSPAPSSATASDFSSSSEGTQYFSVRPATPGSRSGTPALSVRGPTPAPRDLAVPVATPIAITLEPASPPPSFPLSPSDPFGANLHWQLLPYNPHHGKPPLHFDVAHAPDRIRVCSTYPPRPITPRELTKPAADAPLVEMRIRCEALPQWDVRVRRARSSSTSGTGPGGIRCVDVFAAIHETLHRVLTDEERATLPASMRAACEPHFRARCRAAPGLTDYEEMQGLRRIDLLRGRTVFKGLARPSPGREYWVMKLGRAQ